VPYAGADKFNGSNAATKTTKAKLLTSRAALQAVESLMQAREARKKASAVRTDDVVLRQTFGRGGKSD
jgi:hypothetical protein